MTKKPPVKPSPARTARTAEPSAKLSETQLDQVRGGLNFTKISFNTNG